MTKRIQKAIDIFLDAVNSGTLAKGTCIACAVGNLVAAGMGGKITKNKYGEYECSVDNHEWGGAFYTLSDERKQTVNKSELLLPEVIANIEATDFTAGELMKIEYAFEMNTKIESFAYYRTAKEDIRRDQIRGLEAVVKAMLQFDEQPDDVKKVFTEKAELIAA